MTQYATYAERDVANRIVYVMLSSSSQAECDASSHTPKATRVILTVFYASCACCVSPAGWFHVSHVNCQRLSSHGTHTAVYRLASHPASSPSPNPHGSCWYSLPWYHGSSTLPPEVPRGCTSPRTQPGGTPLSQPLTYPSPPVPATGLARVARPAGVHHHRLALLPPPNSLSCASFLRCH